METAYVSINEWMDKKMWIKEIYIYKGILLSLKREWNPVICNNMEEAEGLHAKWNKLDREWQIL